MLIAGTGDHSYWRREYGLATPLLEQRTASIIVPNPFYGERRPDGQYRSSLHVGVLIASTLVFLFYRFTSLVCYNFVSAYRFYSKQEYNIYLTGEGRAGKGAYLVVRFPMWLDSLHPRFGLQKERGN